MQDIREVAENVYQIDDRLYSIPGAGAVYLLAEEQKALIDTGPATSCAAVLDGIRALGYKNEEIDYILITHIHLDHSGGVGTIVRSLPQARVFAHHKAIKHLLDPSRLIASAGDAQGRETIRRNGEVVPLDSAKAVPAHEGDRVRLGSRQTLSILETPGHAPHELCILESRNKGVFVGDAVGHYVPGLDVMVPVTPPPSFDLQAYLQTLERLEKLQPSRIYFAHAGAGEDVPGLLAAARRKLLERDAIIAAAEASNRLDTAADVLTAHICAELGMLRAKMPALYEDWALNDIPMSAAEHVRYYRRQHRLPLSPV